MQTIIRYGGTYDILINARDKMSKTVELFKEQLYGIRLDNISPGFVESCKVQYYGQLTPVRYVAAVSKVQNGITVTPHDHTIVGAVEKSLKAIGLNAYVFSKTTVFVSVPMANLEQQEKIKVQIRKLGEESKVSIRNIRKMARKGLSKDELLVIDKSLQDLTDDFVEQIDEIVVGKCYD